MAEQSEELSTRIKELAAKNEITIELTQEQAEAILRQWDDVNPRVPARLRFVVESRDIAELAVAGYRYRGERNRQELWIARAA